LQGSEHDMLNMTFGL